VNLSKEASWDAICEAAAVELASQQANVVFYSTYKTGAPLPTEVETRTRYFGFRRGVIPLNVPREITHEFVRRESGLEILFVLRNHTASSIEAALRDYIQEGDSLDNSFAARLIDVRRTFMKFLFVSPYGAYGRTLRVLVPAAGVENISWHLLRTTPNVDSVVYNVALGSVSGYHALLRDRTFDVIGFSPVALESDIQLIVDAKNLSPRSKLLVGGPTIRHIPPDAFLKAVPADALAYGDGEETCERLASALETSPSASSLLAVPNLAVYLDGAVLVTEPRRIPPPRSARRTDDVPMSVTDALHRSNYLTRRKEMGMAESHVTDHVGARRLIIELSDQCKGQCTFCNAPKNLRKRRDIEDVVAEIKNDILDIRQAYDSIHFVDNTFSTHHDHVMNLASRLIDEGLAYIPKACKLRADQVDTILMEALAKAGFTRAFFGIESFDDAVLRYLKKGTTSAQNRRALNLTLKVGIIPGLNLILPTPADSPESIRTTARCALQYVALGATLNVVPHLYVDYNMELFHQHLRDVIFRDIFLNGMRGIYKMPITLKLPTSIRAGATSCEKNANRRISQTESETGIAVSIHDYSLVYLSELCRCFQEQSLSQTAESLIRYRPLADQHSPRRSRTPVFNPSRASLGSKPR